jgi:hypothetical protein
MLRLEKRSRETMVRALVSVQNKTIHRCGSNRSWPLALTSQTRGTETSHAAVHAHVKSINSAQTVGGDKFPQTVLYENCVGAVSMFKLLLSDVLRADNLKVRRAWPRRGITIYDCYKSEAFSIKPIPLVFSSYLSNFLQQ